MKKILLFAAFSACAFGQGTTPPTRVFTRAFSGNTPPGYFVNTIGQFDKDVWIPSRGCVSHWGEYKTNSFSEENDAMGCWSYAENQWHMLSQASSQHNVHHSMTGHQWGFTEYVPSIDTMFWTAQSGAQDLEPMWSHYAMDMAGLTIRDIPLFGQNGTSGGVCGSGLTCIRPWVAASTLSGYESYDTTNNLMGFYPDSADTTVGHITTCDVLTTYKCTLTAATGGPPVTQAYSNFRFDVDDGRTYWFTGGGNNVYSINLASPAAWKNFSSPACTGADCTPSNGPPIRVGPGFVYTDIDHIWVLMGGVGCGSVPSDCYAATTEAITACTNASPAVCTTTTAHTTSQTVSTAGFTGAGLWAGCNGNFVATYISPTTFSFPCNTTAFGAMTGTPTVAADLPTWATPVIDVWTFDPTAGSGAGAWLEICGPNATSCGAPGTPGTYPNWTSQRIGDRLVFDHADNVFIVVDDNAGSVPSNANSITWYYPLSTATGKYGRLTGNYVPCSGLSGGTPCAAGVTGPLNRTAPPASSLVSTVQETGAFDLSVDAVSGGSVYLSSVQPTIPTVTTPSYCIFPIPYIYSSGSANLPGGATFTSASQGTACTAINNSTSLQPSGHVYHANIAGIDWEANERRNFAGSSSNGQAQAQSYNGTTWTGGNIGCFSAPCLSVGSTNPKNYTQGLLNANGTLTALTIEPLSAAVSTSDVFVSQYSGSFPLTSLTGSTPLNLLAANSLVTYAAMATDGSGNIMIAWAEEKNNSAFRYQMQTTPQIFVKFWNGASMITVNGGSSLNVTATDWGRSPSVVYASGTWYVAFTEQAQTGVPKVNVFSCPASTGACSRIGGSLNNNATTGLAYHPSLSASSTTPVVGWEEQSAVGQHSLGYISQWTGSAWSSVASGVAADVTNGSIMDIGLVSASSGIVTAAWTEVSWGNLPQIYTEPFSLGSGCQFTSSSTLPPGFLSTSYAFTAATSGCSSPVFSATGLPAGLTINPSTGVISGTPLGYGPYNPVISATGASNLGASLTINAPVPSSPMLF